MEAFALAAVCFSVASAAIGAEPSTAIAEGRQPRLASDGAHVYCVFGKGEEIFCARSADGGTSFSQPVKVATLPSLMLGKRRGPRVVAANDCVIISAISSETGDLVAWRSTDRGETWSNSARVNDADRACREGLFDLAANSDGSVAAIWLDLRNKGTQLWGAASHDGGAAWEANRLVYRSPDGGICPCCHPTVVASGNAWSVLWRNSVAGKRDIYVATSRDGLHSFGDAQRLGDAEWTLDICPMDGGDLAFGQNGGWATWRRETTVYATDLKSPSREIQLGPGEQPVVAVSATGPAFAWISARPGDLMLRTPDAKQAKPIAKQASDPDLISLPDGRVLCTYESIEDGKSIVRVFRASRK
jgi:hypothetical protein